MPASDWLDGRRTEVAADRILDAAEELFTRQGPGAVGMQEIAKAAGCSRATLYRYFENREALRSAYVARETHRLAESIRVDDIDDPRERLVAGVVATLRTVRENPSLSAWFTSNAGPLGAELAEQSDVITGVAAAFVTSLGADDPANVARRGRWLVRAITALLLFPGRDDADERGMLTEFVAPVVIPADKVSHARG